MPWRRARQRPKMHTMKTPPISTVNRGLRMRSLAGSTVLHGVCIAAATLGTWHQLTSAEWRSAHAAPLTATVTLDAPLAPSEQPPLPVPPVVSEPSPAELTCCAAPAPPIEPAPQAETERPQPDLADAQFSAAAWLAPVRAATPPPPPAAAQQQVVSSAEEVTSVQPSPLPGENQPPRYPWVAWRRGIEGTVVVGLDIDRGGAVTETRLLDSSGSSLLDDAALAQLRTWRFPAAAGDAPDLRASRQTVVFRLRN